MKTKYFDTRAKAEHAVRILQEMQHKYGTVSVADWYDICGLVSTCDDDLYRWDKLINARILPADSYSPFDGDAFVVDFFDSPKKVTPIRNDAKVEVKKVVFQADDPVNHPAHYTAGGIECIDAIAAAISCQKDPMSAWLTGQCLKYLWRWPLKNGVEDLKKTRFYLDRLIKYMEEK